jgi:uncharacterized protein DUF3857/transglutaminase superfamily protein
MRRALLNLPCLSVVVILSFSCATERVGAQAAWEIPRFAIDPSALSKVASSLDAKLGTDVVVLTEEDEYVFDASGRSKHTRYMAYRILTKQGLEDWSGVYVRWQPWDQERPLLRARVIAPDGSVHELDPKTITDSAVKDDDQDIYGDSRVLRAPLPAVGPGAVVEEEEIINETTPFFGAGVVERAYFSRPVPVQHACLTLDAPSSLPLQYKLELLADARQRKTEAGGRTRVVVEVGPLDALDDFEPLLPSDVPEQAQVIFSTGASWQSIAQGYARIVDENAGAKEVQSTVNALLSGKSTRDEKVAAILQYLSSEIRYTGVEFGDAAIVPHSPAETIKHKYGDCKDKATLAVAMLRAAGIPANVALLNVGAREDIPSDLPGMGLFDHAIVHIPGPSEVWLDVTDPYARLGQVPESDQGRFALIAAPETSGLVRVWEGSSQDNLITEKRSFALAE